MTFPSLISQVLKAAALLRIRGKHDDKSREAEEFPRGGKWIVGELDQANPNPKPGFDTMLRTLGI
jgi:hypothetical protein